MCKRKVQLVLTSICLLLLSSTGIYAQLSGTYTIGTGGDYTSIGDAISAINSLGVNGDVTLLISSGTYDEEVDLSNLNNGDFHVTLEGEDLENTVIAPVYENPVTGIKIQESDNITISNLTIRMPFESGGTQIGIYVDDASDVTLENNMITSLTGIAIETGANIEVLNNIVVAEDVAFSALDCNTLDIIHNTLHSEQIGFRNYQASGNYFVLTEAVL